MGEVETGMSGRTRRRANVSVTPVSHTAPMASQLVLLEAPTAVAEHDWRIDEDTKTAGLLGVAAARAALAQAARRSAA